MPNAKQPTCLLTDAVTVMNGKDFEQATAMFYGSLQDVY
jgi:hypothetical protein